jgi:hypothetical protein
MHIPCTTQVSVLWNNHFCFARNHNLQCMKIRPHMITEFDEPSNSSVNEVAVVQIDINRHQKSRTFFYIVFKLAFYNLILGLSWMKQNKIILNADRVFLTIEFTETIIQNRKASAESEFNHVMMSAMFFTNLIQKERRNRRRLRCSHQHDQYWKSLNLTEEDWPENYTLWSLSWVFKCVWSYNDWEIAFLKEEGTDHQIELEKIDEKSQKYSEILYTTWQERSY